MERLRSRSRKARGVDSNVGAEGPRNGVLDGSLEILAKPATAIEPSEGALHNPAPRQKVEAFGGIAAPDNFARPAPEFSKSPLKFVSDVTAVSRDVTQPGIGFSDRGQDSDSVVAVMNVGGMHLRSNQMACRVGDDMALAPFDLLAGVLSVRAAAFHGFHRLAVDHADRRTGLATRAFAREHHQRAPRIAAGCQMQDRVGHLAQIGRSWPADSPGFPKEWLHEPPFSIGHVVCVAKLVLSTPCTGDLSPDQRKLNRIVADRPNPNLLG